MSKLPEELQDFRNFMHVVWESAFQRTPEPLQYEIANWMQSLPTGADGVRRGQTWALRGEGKTEIEATLAAWFLADDPDSKGLIICSTAGKASEFMRHVRSIFEHCEFLNHLLPRKGEGRTKDQRDSGTSFEVGAITKPSKDASLSAFGVGSTWTSVHPDWIIVDDVETPENSLTVLRRDKLRQQLSELEMLKKPNGYILITGTPQTEDSVYKKLGKKYPIRKFPARHVDPDSKVAESVCPSLINQVLTGEAKVGDPTSPERFGEAVLAEMEAGDPAYFALQMLLDTRPSDEDRHPLKVRDLVVMDQDLDMGPSQVVWGTQSPYPNLDPAGFDGDVFYKPAWVSDTFLPYTGSLMYIDPSGTGADKVAYAVLKFLEGMFFLQAVGGLAGGSRGSADPVMERLAEVARDFHVNVVVIESNYGDGMYAQLFAPVLARVAGPMAIKDHRVTGQKELRIIDTLKPLTKNHRLVIAPSVAKNHDFIYQLSHITRSKGALAHEDELDAVAGACAQFTAYAALDPKVREEQREKKEKEELIKEWESHFRTKGHSAGGRRTSSFERLRRGRERARYRNPRL